MPVNSLEGKKPACSVKRQHASLRSLPLIDDDRIKVLLDKQFSFRILRVSATERRW